MSGSTASSGVGGGDRSIADAIPPAEPLEGSHGTYEKGEVSSIGALISDISTDLTTLLRQEVALAKAEATQSATKAGKAGGMLAGAGVAGHFVLLFLSLALWVLLVELLDGSWGWAFLIVAVLWGIVAAVLASMGRKELKEVTGLERTADTAKRVPDALKGNEGTR
ncbi:phage holin family protein [Nocardioides sp.]|uniref:phage holin family protein n=1 Tax=Nocardioides sp. TaxID=35761 RepID=UPI002C9AEDF3|nr:phage holin family protein [Nocardioides sp.]HXH79387.1 phage holin family protein [Nocardioides sp.]